MKTIAIIGRPNVGKSTISNTLSEYKKAVTSPIAGTTRDFVEQIGEWQGKEFRIIDTGGIILKPEDLIEKEVQKTLKEAFDKADIIIEVVDAKTGIHPLDRKIAKQIKQTKKDSFLLVNKVDSQKWEAEAAKFKSLGFEKTFHVSALSGLGLGDFLDELTKNMDDAPETDSEVIKFAFFGKTNVGKSSLYNSIIGEKRVIESDVPGTTVDIIETTFEYKAKKYSISDTAGIRKKSKVHAQIEVQSRKRALQVLSHIDVACFVIDASKPISRQDKRIASILEEAFVPTLIIINKTDLIAPLSDPDSKDVKSIFYAKKREIEEKLSMLYFADTLFTSAKDTFQVESIIRRVTRLKNQSEVAVSQEQLDDFLEKFIIQNPPRASRKHKTANISKLTLESSKPVIFGIKKSSKGFISENYLTFLKRALHKKLKLTGIPIHLKIMR
jgi:GTP-binding protein